MASKYRSPALIILAALLAGIFAWTGSSSPLRPGITFIFMLIVPGLAITRLFNLKDFLAEVVLAIALSLVTSTILAEFMVFTHIWSPNAGLGALILVSLSGAALQIRNQSNSIRRESA